MMYASCTVYKMSALVSLPATLAEYLVVLLTIIETARRSPLEHFGLNDVAKAAEQRWLAGNTLVWRTFATGRATPRAVQLAFTKHSLYDTKTTNTLWTAGSNCFFYLKAQKRHGSIHDLRETQSHH